MPQHPTDPTKVTKGKGRKRGPKKGRETNKTPKHFSGEVKANSNERAKSTADILRQHLFRPVPVSRRRTGDRPRPAACRGAPAARSVRWQAELPTRTRRTTRESMAARHAQGLVPRGPALVSHAPGAPPTGWRSARTRSMRCVGLQGTIEPVCLGCRGLMLAEENRPRRRRGPGATGDWKVPLVLPLLAKLSTY